MRCCNSRTLRNIASGYIFHMKKCRYSVSGILHRKNFCSTPTTYFPQPTSLSHPHELKKNEITPEIDVNVYKSRRHAFMQEIYQKISSSVENRSAHLVVVPSNSVVYMSENIPYVFRQNSDFLYLCGFKEPNSILVLNTSPDKPEHETTMFIPKQSSHSMKWEGPKMDAYEVAEFLGIDQSLYVDDFERYLQNFFKSHKQFTLWYDINTSSRMAQNTMQDFMAAFTGMFTVESPRSILHQVRLIKSSEEIELMRRSCQIAAESMKEVMKFSHANIPEAHLQAKMDYECCVRGADRLAFPPVVAGGNRANIIHYINNNNIIQDHDMVLMDSGCEYHGYNSDMTRTWPVNGKYTGPQRELYEFLLQTQEELIQICNVDLSLDELFETMCMKLGKGLQELGIIPQSLSQNQLHEAAYELCPHHVGHYLGMDVHDTNLISRNIKLKPGMIVTVEPGIYLSKNNKKCPEKYRGLGIRIEDDILITNEGNEVLTSDCPKHVDQVEELVQAGRT